MANKKNQMREEDKWIVDIEIILTMENYSKVKVSLTQEEKKVFMSLLSNFFKDGIDTEPYLEHEKSLTK